MKYRVVVITLVAGAFAWPVGAQGAALPHRMVPHGMGLILPKPGHRAAISRTARSAAGLPTSVNLTHFAMPVGDQGQTSSCASWATVYTAMGYWENKDGLVPPGGGEPMYAYSQVNQGSDDGSSIAANLDIATAQGIDSRADYSQGDFDWRDPPTSGEQANAAHWKLTDYSVISPTQVPIEAALAAGDPVTIGIPVTEAFEWDQTARYPYDSNYDDNVPLGNHALTALGYDSTGLLVENSWGAWWGYGGYVTIGWGWVNADVQYAVAVDDISHATPPTPPKPTPPKPIPPKPTPPKPAPAPRITTHPANVTTSRTATFRYTDAKKGITFKCRLDKKGAWRVCKSPKRYAGLKLGSHSFELGAVLNGRPTAMTSFRWKVVRKRR
jgi:hypothetical protein